MSTKRVFISYSHDDTKWVSAFAEVLRQKNVNVWLDQWEIALGEPLRDAIEAGLRQSDTIVTVVSRSNVNNPNMLFELGVALGMGKRLIPIVAEDLEASSIPFDLRVRRYITMGRPDEAAQEVASVVMQD